MTQETVHKVAATIAASLAEGKKPEKSWCQAIARKLQDGTPVEQKALEGVLRSFGQPRLHRYLHRYIAHAKEYPDTSQDISLPPGQTLLLFKSSLPGESQAHLAYECFQNGFLSYLQRTRYVCLLNDSPAHITLFVPGEQHIDLEKDLEKMWQKYVQEDVFSDKGLAKSFVLLLNSVQLARRGFGVLDVPIISEKQRHILAGFYLAAVDQVARRLKWRAGEIQNTEKELETAQDKKERERTEKRFKTLQDKQQGELKKYQTAFTKALTVFLDKEGKRLQKATKRKGKPQRVATLSTTFREEQVRHFRNLLNTSGGNPFEFLAKDQKARPDVFRPILQAAERFTERAGNQLATAVGAKLAGIVLEAYRLIDGRIPLTEIPALFSTGPLAPAARNAGDGSGEWCYSCGKALGKKETAYEVRRLLFSSPDQRPQSGSAALRPKACSSCAAIALTCPLKLSDQNVVIRLVPKTEAVGTDDYLRDYCRMLTIGTLNTSAGRYLSLVCTEQTAKGVLASTRLGKVVYAIAKLGLELPADVFCDFNLVLITEGSHISLDTAVLFATAGFLDGYQQRMIVGGDLNTTLGQVVRHIRAGRFYAAEYTLVAKGLYGEGISLEQHRSELWKFLKKQGEEPMNNHDEQRAKLYGDVAALTGLLYAFCAALRNEVRKDREKDVGRILSKAIEYVDDSPAFFTYTVVTNKLPSESARLYKDPRHHFLYDRLKSLLECLGLGNREEHEETSSYLQLHFDDITKAYDYFSTNCTGEREWKEFLYQTKLSLYSRFPECFKDSSSN